KINSLVAAAKKNCTDHPDLPACKGGA
ncbi:MAG: hypothetical protein QOE54_4666, partial [Streptosporangiaceae bacterium]|nr:hypothetical protein [Streptosporangiaceae bacterium]